MANETIEGLKRLSWLPEREDGLNGTLIAGQEYDDVYIIGGTLENLDISNATIDSSVITNSTISGSTIGGFTASRAIVSNGSGNLTAATTTATEIGFVNGVTSAIQTQLNGKQPTGNYITALTGDVTASGPGSVAATLATVNSNVGSFTNASITVNAKGLITAASSGAAPIGGSTGAVDNAVLRADGTGGSTVQSSAVTIADTTGVIAGTQGVTFSGSTSGTTSLVPTAIAGTTTQTMQAVTGTIYCTDGTDVSVADGGTGLSSATAYAVLCGGTTSTGAFQSIASVGTSGQILTSNGAAALPTMQTNGAFVQIAVAVNSTSGTSIDFTSIPSGVKLIIINFSGFSTNGTSNPLIQIGDSGGIENSGYLGSSGASNFTTGYGIAASSASNVLHGQIILALLDSSNNTWTATGMLARSDAAGLFTTGGSKSLSATLDRVRITTVGGTDTFDAGVVNIIYEV